MSDPNDIIKNAKLPEEKGFTPTPGSFMGRVEKAGGIEAYEEAKKFMEEVSKVKPEQWTKLTETFKVIKGFLDVETSVFKDMQDEIISSLKLKTEELLSPLKNEFNALINTLLEPILPFLQDMVNLIVPIIQWLADRIQDVIDFFGIDHAVGMRYGIEQYTAWLRANPGGSFADFLVWLNRPTTDRTNTYRRLVE